MKENLITNEKNNNIDNNSIANEEQLFREIKKMLYIKYLNLFFSIFRLFLMFYSLSSLGYLSFFGGQQIFI